MKRTQTIAIALSALALSSVLPSCIVSQAVDVFVREEYPGTPPPMVIADVNGSPASNARWLRTDPDALPAPSNLIDKRKADVNGVPYGFTSQYANVVISPFTPYNSLSYKGFKGGDRVWDPYTRKVFIIPRIHTIN